MIFSKIHAQLLIAQFNNLNLNPQVKNMADAVKCVIIPFKGGINPVDPQGVKLYPQDTK